MISSIPPQCRYVFAANFLNRASEFPWLVRRANQPVCHSVPCMTIEARHVIFTDSGAEEKQHGCKLTATMQVHGREDVRFGATFERRPIPPLEPLPEALQRAALGMAKRAELLWLPGLEPRFVSLKFNPEGFTVEDSGEPVEAVHTLRLNEDRSISAILYPTPVFNLAAAA